MHLLPAVLVLAVLALAWRWEWVGGVVFPLLGGLYIVMAWGRFHWTAYAMIAGPLFVLGGLFVAAWLNPVRGRGVFQDLETH
ncbi:MAG: hypothetical protein AB7O66_21650 [Limisphaerales bacterium]